MSTAQRPRPVPTEFQRRWRTAVLTHREIDAIRFWRYGGSQEVCYAIRHPRAAKAEPNSAEVGDTIHILDALTRRWAIGAPMEVFRGAWVPEISVGDRLRTPCFLSVTTNQQIALSFLDHPPRDERGRWTIPTLFEVRLPPEQTALCIACLPPTYGRYLAEQRELVLPRRTSLEVVGVRAHPAMTVGIVEVV